MKKYIVLFSLILGSLVNAQIADKAEDISPVLIGEKIPQSTLISFEGKETKSNSIFKDKKTILVVYRGGWCPFCNTQLSDLGAIQDEFINLGYQIVAVSPDSFEKEAKTIDKNDLSYQLYSDNSTEFIQKLGIAFKAPGIYSKMLKKHSAGKNDSVLPAPSIFIIDEKGVILFEYISPDYKNRMDGDLLLKVADHLK